MKVTEDMTTYIKENYNKFKVNARIIKNTNKTVWHELEHIGYIQGLKGEKLDKGYNSKTMIESVDPIDIFNEKVKYLSQQYEKIAFVKSLKGNAVRNKTSLINDIRTFIHEQLYLNDRESEKLIKQHIGGRVAEIEQNLVSQYIKYALETYPNIINYKNTPNSLK